MRGTGPWRRAALSLAASMALLVLLATDLLGDTLTAAVDNFAKLTAALIAATTCALAARRTGRQGQPRLRRTWALLAVGVGAWACGQVVWTIEEVVLGRVVESPSLSDIGFLLFPIITSIGFLAWLAPGLNAVRWSRDLLDGGIIAISLLVLSWSTTTRLAFESSDASPLALVVAMVNPLGDVAMATVLLLTVARTASGNRAVLGLVATGLGCLAVADSAFLYLTSRGHDTSGGLVGAVWVLGFLLIAVGATGNRGPQGDGRPRLLPAAVSVSWSRLCVVLPYVPMVVAQLAVGWRLLHAEEPHLLDVVGGGLLFALMLARQFVAMADNQLLLIEVSAVQHDLRHQVLHDPLTGLANRALFNDRVDHALARRPGVLAPAAVVYCDLDHFKAVNDARGHAAGDALLLLVAERLRASLRPSDTIARLGGDEFAILLEGAKDPAAVARRVLAAVIAPAEIDGVPVQVGISIGIALHDPASPGMETADSLLDRADAAMYMAKAAGKAGDVGVHISGSSRTSAPVRP